jgi:putative two-component system response regulator
MTNEVAEKLRILIVDDVEANRFALRDIITDMGYQPVLTESGEQALRVAEHFPIQLIISDIAMPGMDGYELCKRFKGNANTREIPIIFISAFDDPQDIVRGFSLGGEDYITKPFIPEIVQARVGLHLRLYEANRNLLEINRQLQVSVHEQLRQMEMEKKNVLYALIRIARENACYDEEHMEHTSYNCRILAEAMQLSPKYGHLISDSYVDTIELAAPLCDLGNVAIPTMILQKEQELDEDESRIMQTHTTIGAKILADIQASGDYNAFLEMSQQIANYHHENWDGSGYPEGLSGEEIPLAAQIVAIVSEYCALVEKRTYRGAYSHEDAFDEMKNDVGIKFNPDIFDIMCKISRQLH